MIVAWPNLDKLVIETDSHPPVVAQVIGFVGIDWVVSSKRDDKPTAASELTVERSAGQKGSFGACSLSFLQRRHRQRKTHKNGYSKLEGSSVV